jgi:hypothetical protein
MKNFYLIGLLFLFSCSTRINYVGSRQAPTNQVEVFVDQLAIKKNYDIIGQGFVNWGLWTDETTRRREEILQEKVIEKAKKIGADAVLFNQLIFVNPYYRANRITHKRDGVPNQKNNNGTRLSSIDRQFDVYFIKYTQ